MPAETPVTMPLKTVALVLLALQIPPALLSVSVIDEPTHTADGPEMLSAIAVVSIVTAFDAVAVPHKFVTVYVIVSIPEGCACGCELTSPLALVRSVCCCWDLV